MNSINDSTKQNNPGTPPPNQHQTPADLMMPRQTTVKQQPAAAQTEKKSAAKNTSAKKNPSAKPQKIPIWERLNKFRKPSPKKPTTTLDQTEKKEDLGEMTLKDVIAPSSIEVDFNHIQIGQKYYRTLFASGYPRFVGPNWLSPLINFEHSLHISTFYYPVNSKDVLQKLKRKLSEMEATLYGDMEKGKILDPSIKIALSDAKQLQEAIAAGTEKFFHFALYITISAESVKILDKITNNAISTLAAINVVAKPASLQMEQAFLSSLPTGTDQLYITRNMDTTSLATTFPFVSSELTMDHGVMYGVNMHNKSLIIFDRFEMENANSVIFAKSGAGKSYFVKLEAIRSLMLGTDVIIIDPEKEFERLCNAVNGDYITFTQDKGSKVNPFELSGLGDPKEDELRMKILALHGFFKVIFDGLTNVESSIMDRALILTYREKGITTDPATQRGAEPPLLEDLYKILQGMADKEAHGLAQRLEKYIMGSAAGVFNEKSNVSINNPFTVFSIRDLQEELRPMAMYMMLDYIWTKIKRDRRKRLLIVDEAWIMMQHKDSSKFIYSMAKRARKYWLGLTTITQDVEDFLTNDYGKAIVTNSSIQILLKQSTAAIDKIQHIFNLSDGEKHFLLSCARGEGLFFAGSNHVAIKIISSLGEHLLITSDPREVELMKQTGIEMDTSEISELSGVFDNSPIRSPKAKKEEQIASIDSPDSTASATSGKPQPDTTPKQNVKQSSTAPK
ncbi:MAG: ATP-binding protein [Patescibacteria group bacterium]|nr:ATP-binding protein [Patescibacteria group bacterium]